MAEPPNPTVALFHYTNDPSAQRSSTLDFQIGFMENICGSNNSNTARLDSGDICVIASFEYNRWLVIIGMIEGRLECSDIWKKRGGRIWKHNYKFNPLCLPFVVMKNHKDGAFIKHCNEAGLPWYKCLNSGFHGYRNEYYPILKKMFQ